MNWLISVIMSVYNEEIEWVKQSVESILNQTYSAFEFIIVVDNPQIETSVLDYLKEKVEIDQRVILIQNDVNIGLAKSLNKGISVAKGAYIARMDADDIAELSRFEKQVKFMTKNNVDLVGTGKILINERGEVISEYKKCVVENDEIRKILPYTSCLVHPSIMIKAEYLKRVNGYRNFRQSQDYDLWLRLLSDGCVFANIDEPLLKYRVREGGISCKRPYLQYKTSDYQAKLYRERMKRNKDSFSEVSFQNYLEKNNAFSELKNRKYASSLMILDEGIGTLKRDRLCGMISIVKAILIFPEIIVVLYKKFMSYKYMA